MRADHYLVLHGFFESRAKAQAAISAGLVTANDKQVAKASETIPHNAVVKAEAPHPFVSRGGVKLAFALDYFNLSIEGLNCLDVGSSTGGFSHVLLERGAKHITAVDTGRDQFHKSLRGNARISLFEATDIRTLTLDKPAEFTAIDVSFIPLKLVLPSVIKLMSQGSHCIALIKPQFETGKKDIGKGGIVKDEAVHTRVCNDIAQTMLELGLIVLGLAPSPLQGGDGNREFLICARKP